MSLHVADGLRVWVCCCAFAAAVCVQSIAQQESIVYHLGVMLSEYMESDR